MKVILVDDEKKFVTMLAKRLSLRGIQTDFVFSGDEAIKKMADTGYDIAVLDIKMPGISGIELKRKLRELSPELKIIFLTGHGAVEKSERESFENDLYLSKPLNIEILIKKINEIADTG